MKKDNPKVTIVIPVYNGSNYVKKAIDSALAQTYNNIEILVINDGSTDNTEEIVKSYGKKVKYYKKENGGVSTALNLALKKMTGEYFSWLSHDDEYYNNRIEAMVEEIKKHDDYTILYGDYALINENSELITNVKKNHKMLLDKPEYSLLKCHVNGITMLIPKKAFDYAGEFDPKLKCTQDYDMWTRMSKKYKFIHVDKILSRTRIHELQGTNCDPRVMSEGNPFWIKYIESIPDDKKIELEGSIYGYYYSEYMFLCKTFYKEATDYFKNKLEKEYKEEFSKDIKILKSRKLKKLYYLMKYKGIKNTTRRCLASVKKKVSKKRK